MKRAAVLTLILAAAIAGCQGGGGSEPNEPASLTGREQMDAVAQAWADAFGSGDIDRMCDLTDEPGSASDPYSCKGIYEFNDAARELDGVTVKRSDYVGNEGVVQFSNGEVIQMRVKNGRWVVFSFGGKQPYKVGYDPLAD